MKYIVIPIVVALALIIIAIFRKTVQEVSRNKKMRVDLFEMVGKEWISLINAELIDELVYRDPGRTPIPELFLKKENIWIISVPLIDTLYGEFDMLIGMTLVHHPKPQIQTVLIDLIITTDSRQWWLPQQNAPVLHEVREKMVKIGRIFDVAEPGSL